MKLRRLQDCVLIRPIAPEVKTTDPALAVAKEKAT